jgi:hypothetical protein
MFKKAKNILDRAGPGVTFYCIVIWAALVIFIGWVFGFDKDITYGVAFIPWLPWYWYFWLTGKIRMTFESKD